MGRDTTLSEMALPWELPGDDPDRQALHVVIAWSLDEPDRVGEVAIVDAPCVLGRGTAQPGDPAPRLRFFRFRPPAPTETRALEGPRISRLQLKLTPLDDERIEVENVGRCALLVDGEVVDRTVVRVGETITLKNALLLAVVRRPVRPEPIRNFSARLSFDFGTADHHGLVGESPAMWALREQLAFAARSPHHVLLLGPSGVGKEIAARALHALSSRGGRPLISRNAATLPESLVDAELFGTAKNYPNAGMPERAGLIREADGSTLFLDEIGELPAQLQAHLLRVLDRGGEYQTLGESRVSRSDLRLVAATNRDTTELKHDFAARFALRIEVPGLEQRREDIPLLVRHLLSLAVAQHPDLAERFFERRNGRTAEARLDPALVDGLVRHAYTHHIRELERLLWLALSTSRGQFIAATPEVLRELSAPPERGDESAPEPDREMIEAALAEANGSVTRAARRLGLKNRFVLYRLMKRHGLQGDASE